MAFTAKDVQALREKTGCGMMDCKKALTEADGNMDKAIEFLREKGLAAAAKKADRIAAEGVVYAAVKGNVGAVVEVNSETDFVAKNEQFMNFVKGVADVIIARNPADVEALLKLPFSETQSVEEALREKILTIGENMSVRRFVRYEGNCVCYIHGGGRIGVLVDFDADAAVASQEAFQEMGKDVAMQIAALNPSYLDESAVPAEEIAKEKEILMAQIQNDPKNANKPAQIVEKMVEGRIGKFYTVNCLVDQEFVKDNTLTVGKYVQSVAQKLGGKLAIRRFVRLEKGEGLQKKEENFAAEIAKMVK